MPPAVPLRPFCRQAPNLVLTKTTATPTIDVGDQVAFTLALSNTGLGMATGVQLTDELPTMPAASMYIPVTSPKEAVDHCQLIEATGARSRLVCDLGDLTPAATVVLNLTMHTSAGSAGVFDNIGTASAANIDPAVCATCRAAVGFNVQASPPVRHAHPFTNGCAHMSTRATCLLPRLHQP